MKQTQQQTNAPRKRNPKNPGPGTCKKQQTYMQAKIQNMQLLEVFFSFFSCIFLIFLFVVFLNFLSSDRRPSQKCNKMHNSRIRIFFSYFSFAFLSYFFAIHFACFLSQYEMTQHLNVKLCHLDFVHIFYINYQLTINYDITKTFQALVPKVEVRKPI